MEDSVGREELINSNQKLVESQQESGSRNKQGAQDSKIYTGNLENDTWVKHKKVIPTTSASDKIGLIESSNPLHTSTVVATKTVTYKHLHKPYDDENKGEKEFRNEENEVKETDNQTSSKQLEKMENACDTLTYLEDQKFEPIVKCAEKVNQDIFSKGARALEEKNNLYGETHEGCKVNIDRDASEGDTSKVQMTDDSDVFSSGSFKIEESIHVVDSDMCNHVHSSTNRDTGIEINDFVPFPSHNIEDHCKNTTVSKDINPSPQESTDHSSTKEASEFHQNASRAMGYEYAQEDFCKISRSSEGFQGNNMQNYMMNILRIVLIGQTGAGKSETGNTLLGAKKFKASPSSKSCTEICQRETMVKGDNVVEILDTPGLFDTHKPTDELRKELLKCMVMTSPGPHAFLLIFRMNRITEQEKKTLEYLKDMFGGDHFLKHTIVVITRKDDLMQCDEAKNNTDEEINQLFKSSFDKSPDLHHVISQCGSRYFLISNKGKVDKPKRVKQANELLVMINEMVMTNGHTFYSYQYFINLEEMRKLVLEKEAERQEEQKRIEKDRKEKEKLAEIKERELELKLEKAEKEREREKKNAEREKSLMEAQLREERAASRRLEEERRKQVEHSRYLRQLENERQDAVRRRANLRYIIEERQEHIARTQQGWGCIVM